MLSPVDGVNVQRLHLVICQTKPCYSSSTHEHTLDSRQTLLTASAVNLLNGVMISHTAFHDLFNSHSMVHELSNWVYSVSGRGQYFWTS